MRRGGKSWPAPVGGAVDDGYGPVADAFRANFAYRGDVGGAVAVYRHGVKVVDLWGGYRDRETRAPWRDDTVVTVFSTTKGVSAIAVAVAVSRDWLDYDARVADYWPDFAQAGKDTVTVRQLLSHQAGLAALDPSPTLADVADTERLSAMLAAARPAWPPGRYHGYHAVTLGWYESELIRHVDPAGRTLGRFFADEIARPLGLEMYIGLPDTVDRDRVAHVYGWHPVQTLLHLDTMVPRVTLALMNPRSLTSRAFMIPTDVAGLDAMANREEVRVVEIPASNGIGAASAIAALYGAAATADVRLGLTESALEALMAEPTLPTNGRKDKVMFIDTVYSLGFWKPFPAFQFGSTDRAFGTPGAGGSFGFADPDTGIGFAYVTNRLGFSPWSDPRELALRRALFETVLGGRAQS
ncbi:serine hydrolase [Mycolicibacterium sp. BiH015]|uniref:serine hydrolase domain-containing protein n=1 Tax=Mycolicibacterium sp. BiH015 TaxID=3018808 RepID=UPI0022E527C4|nr:serine hydrolase domain-containing protein [Mycolicibacterium sp. BiH015]MDA2895409.1 serine hydrolase [Mycolicibacterium sp. BiH015]